MATESVATLHPEPPQPIGTEADLYLTGDEVLTVYVSRYSRLSPPSAIIDGFSAIGELSWRAAMFDGGSIDPDIFAKLAPLQTQLAELVSTLRCTEANAASFRRKLDAAQPAAGA